MKAPRIFIPTARQQRSTEAGLRTHKDLILRSGLLAASRRMDAMHGLAAILRDARKSALLRMRSELLRRDGGDLLRPVICPTGKSVNYLSSPSCKNIPVFAAPKSPLHPSPSRPTEGRIRIVRDAGRDAVDAAESGEQVNCRAGFGLSQTRERSNGAQTNGAEAYGEVVWFWHPLLGSNRRGVWRH